MKKILFTAFTFITVTLGVFALSSDYKNNLLKIDLNKLDSSNYNVELYTQKPYAEPIKVIKKSDFDYYILLPETYHSITSTASNADIKSLDVKLYPYAGADVNNGYTKVNILTSRPINFSLALKTVNSADAPKIDTDKLAKLDEVFAKKTVREGQLIPKIAPAKSEIKASEGTKNVETGKLAKADAKTPRQIDVNKLPNTVQQSVKSVKLAQEKSTAKTQSLARDNDYKIKTNKIATPNTTVVSIPKAKAPAVKVGGAGVTPKAVTAKKPQIAQAPVATTVTKAQSGKSQIIEIEKAEDTAQAPDQRVPAAAASIDIPEAPTVLDRVPQDILSFTPDQIIETLPAQTAQVAPTAEKEDTITPQIAFYIEKAMKDNFILIMSTFAFALALLAILMMKHQRQIVRVRERGAEDGKMHLKAPEIVEEIIEVVPTQDGAAKIVFKEPRVAQEELYYANNPIKDTKEDDSEIYTRKPSLKSKKVVIQDVSTLDEAPSSPLNLPEIPGDKPKFKKKKAAEDRAFKPTPLPPVLEPVAAQNPIKRHVAPAKTDEARILCAATVKDDRGFCLVSHNGIMALTGWVGEDIFVLHRFKKDEVQNPLIKYRLSEKTLSEEHYLVKVENMKFLVRSTRTRMGLELVV